MIVKVDGWIYELPEEAEFIEFSSSFDNGSGGTFEVLDKHANPLKYKSLGLPEDVHWTKRINGRS